jgi:hypothetical protein
MQKHFMVSESDGALYDTRAESWSSAPPLRANYKRHHGTIGSVADLKATLRAGAYAWPGGYPVYLVLEDGCALCFQCAADEFRMLVEDTAQPPTPEHGYGPRQWRVDCSKINWEDSDLRCEHCAKLIESAYGDG